MRRKPSLNPVADPHAVRLAWLAAFLLTVALIAMLGLARSAAASPSARGPAATAVVTHQPHEEAAEEEDEGEEVAAPEGRSEAEEAAEAGEWEEFEAELEAEEAAEEEAEAVVEEELAENGGCPLSDVRATVVASDAGRRVRLTLHYSAIAPAEIAFSYGAHGAGLSHLGSGSFELTGTNGAVHDTASLGDAAASRLLTTHQLNLKLRPLEGSGSCYRLGALHLLVKHAGRDGAVWALPGGGVRAS